MSERATVKRWKVTHCRDESTKPGTRWDVWEIDTNDTHEKPTWLGFGSHEQCLTFAISLARLRYTTGMRP